MERLWWQQQQENTEKFEEDINWRTEKNAEENDGNKDEMKNITHIYLKTNCLWGENIYVHNTGNVTRTTESTRARGTLENGGAVAAKAAGNTEEVKEDVK